MGTSEVPQFSPDVLRSSMSSSTNSSRRGSLKPTLPVEESPPPTPAAPLNSLTRKRAASFTHDSPSNPRLENLDSNSASHGGPLKPAREQVCLCQPEPKIPRPRNAFILYRQHYQAQVVAQNPGLANPEISKLIGQQWGAQPETVKVEWKRLAEEEKQRHQRQHPNYKYQPRRAGKPNTLRPISSSNPDDPIRCPKCGGRYILTASKSLTPSVLQDFAADMRPPSERLPPPLSISRANDFERSRYEAQGSWIGTLRPAPSCQPSQRRPQYAQPQQAHQEVDEDMDFMSSNQGQKRRKLINETAQVYLPSPTPYGHPQLVRNGVPPMSAGGYRPTTPRMHGRSEPLGPRPPQSAGVQQCQERHRLITRSSTFTDETLQLPPINTLVPRSNSTPAERSDQCEAQARSVEAMVMTIPYINKINVLRTISGPLATPFASSPGQATRGAVIAVEGADQALLDEVGAFVHDFLNKEPCFTVKVWNTSSPLEKGNAATNATEDTGNSNAQTDRPITVATEFLSDEAFADYLSVVSHWHRHSQEMIKHITTDPFPSSNNSSTTASKISSRALPIALIPHGFSLTKSDTHAVQIPINDSYSPMDHWQWMATLWRGIVGPDLTIYVDRVTKEEANRYGGVEIRSDCNTIVVRVLNGGQLEEKAMRRLGFEVVEFVRGFEAGI